MGIALGNIGMRLSDFERCTPAEFSAVYEAWHARREEQIRNDWEQTRMLCLHMIIPYSSKTLRPRDVMEFPWEKRAEPQEETLTPEERRERYQAALHRYGMNENG